MDGGGRAIGGVMVVVELLSLVINGGGEVGGH